MKRCLAVLLLCPTVVLAEDTAEAARPGAYKPMEGVEYYCTDNVGNRAELGEVKCFTASCLTWTARCEMTANNNFAMWRKLQDGCPGASLLDRIERLQPGIDAAAVHTKI